jgi:hypothetical protein
MIWGRSVDISTEPVDRCRCAAIRLTVCFQGGKPVSGLFHDTLNPRHSTVTPVRTIRISLCMAALLAAGPISEATAQQSNVGRTVGQREREARKSWSPTRPSGSRATSQPSSAAVRRVDHSDPVGGIPSVRGGSVSIIDPPIIDPPTGAVPIHSAPVYSDSYDGQILDGQIVSPAFDSSCDSMPTGGCSGCDSTGCDSMGCGGCDGACGGQDCSMCGELCSPEAWRPCVTLCLPQDGWASFEYLSWWQDGMSLPPLVTSNTTSSVPQAEAGVLTSPTVRILYGNNDVLTDQFDGGRLRFGLWLDRCHTWGIGAEYFQIGAQSESFTATSTGDPILARPFFNVLTAREDAELVAYPGVLSGTVGVNVESELTGAGVHLRHLRCCDQGCSKWLFCGCKDHYCSRSEALFGWRYLQLDESVGITEDLTSADGSFLIGDNFQTRNQFNGVDLGWSYRQTRGYWTFDSLIRLGVGNTRQTVRINGQTKINSPQSTPPTQTLPGGLLTQTSNIGTYNNDQFSVVPELNVNIGYQLTDHFRLMAGYTFIYWSNVVRPGHHIDRDVNTDLLPPPVDPRTGPLRPAFALDTTDYWVQGLNAGLEYRW